MNSVENELRQRHGGGTDEGVEKRETPTPTKEKEEVVWGKTPGGEGMFSCIQDIHNGQGAHSKVK
jgi:hypothetical protein